MHSRSNTSVVVTSFTPRGLLSQQSLVWLLLVLFMVWLPATQAATLYWDADGNSTASTGGAGTWDTSSSLWRNGSATGTLTAWPTALASASDATAVLGGTAGTLTLNSSVILGGMQAIPSSGTSYTVSGSGRLNFIPVSGTPVVDVQSGSTLTLTAAVNGVNGLQKTSAGTLILDNVGNRLTGGITVSGGTLQAGSATNNAASNVLRSNAVNLANGASLTTVGTSGNLDLRVGALSGSGSVTPATGGAINIMALADAAFSGSITTTGGVNVRGANATQTFSGTVSGLTGSIGISGVSLGSGSTSAGLTLSGTGALTGASTSFALRGGTLTLDNTGGNTGAGSATDRMLNSGVLTTNGGTLSLLGNATNGSAETAGALTLNAGAATFSVTHNGASGGTVLTLASIARTSGVGATVNFVGIGGTLGSAGANPRILFTTAPGLTNNVIANSSSSSKVGFATVNGADFAGYDNTLGVVAISTTSVSGTLTTAPTQNSLLNGSGTIGGSAVNYNTLKILAGAGATLSLSGAGNYTGKAILLAGADDFTIQNTNSSTSGLGGSDDRYIFVSNAVTTLNVAVTLAGSQQNVVKSGDGFMALTGTSSQVGFTSNSNIVIANGVLRGTLTNLGGGTSAGGAFTTIQMRGGVLEISGGGTLTRAVDKTGLTNGGGITFDEGAAERGNGGFSAINGNATVTLVTTIAGSTAASLVWNDNAFLSNGYVLTMGSSKADSRIDFTNNIGLDDGTATNSYFAREIRVSDNTGSTGDVARLSGVISGSSSGDLLKTGAGVLELTGSNTYSGNTLIQQGTLLANNTGSTSATGTGNVILGSGAVLGGTGRIATAADGQVFVQGTVRVGSVAPTTGEKLTIDSSASGAMTIVASTGIMEFDLFARGGDLSASTAAADRLAFSGLLSLQSGARLKINNLTGASSSTTFASGDVWRLFDWSSLTVSGTFTTDVADLPTLGSGLVWDFSNLYTAGTITVAVPEPTRGLLLLLGGMLLIFRRRKING